jgi:hypothetical protein
VAASNQRTPARRRLPVTLAAGSAADSSRPDTRPRPEAAADTRTPPRCPGVWPKRTPPRAAVDGGGRRRSAGPGSRRPSTVWAAARSAPARLWWSTRTGRRGQRTPTVRTGGQQTRLVDTDRPRPHGDMNTRYCGRGHWTLRQRPAGQPAAEPSTTTMTPVGRRRTPTHRTHDLQMQSGLPHRLGRFSASSNWPHPYHGTTRNRCADPRFPRSHPTVEAEVIGSPSAKLCAHLPSDRDWTPSELLGSVGPLQLQWPARTELVGVLPGPEPLEGGACRQHVGVTVAAAD